MNTTERLLLYILSGALAVFLVVSIVALIKIIQILGHLKSITEKAEQIADRAELASAMFERTASRISLMRLIGNISEAVTHHKKKARNTEEEDDE